MINPDQSFIERFLQRQRFRRVLHLIQGNTLDFGGNKGELGQFLDQGSYTVCNYDYSVLEGKMFDTIVSLAVLEHIDQNKVIPIMKMLRSRLRKGGRIILTTPTKLAKPMIEIMSKIGIIEKDNVLEHRHYYTRNELEKIGRAIGLRTILYEKFQFGMNQLLIMKE